MHSRTLLESPPFASRNLRGNIDRCFLVKEALPSTWRSYAQQRVIVIDVEQRPMIAGCVTALMIRIAAEVLKNPVGGASWWLLSPGGTEVGTRLCEGYHPFRFRRPAVVGQPASDHHGDKADQKSHDDVDLRLS